MNGFLVAPQDDKEAGAALALASDLQIAHLREYENSISRVAPFVKALVPSRAAPIPANIAC